jgi:hypothetical protein
MKAQNRRNIMGAKAGVERKSKPQERGCPRGERVNNDKENQIIEAKHA